MTVQQLSIFAEDKPGSLARVTSILANHQINIRATTISTSDTFGVISLIVDRPDDAYKILSADGIMVTLRDVIAVLIDDKPGGLNKFMTILQENGININNAYGFVLERSHSAVFIVNVESEQLEKTQLLIKESGFNMLDSKEISEL